MVTLANLQGQDLVPGLENIFKSIDLFREQQDERKANKAFTGILTEQLGAPSGRREEGTDAATRLGNVVPGGVSQSQIKNIQTLGQLDSAKAKIAFDLIRKGQQREIEQAQQDVEERAKIAIALKQEKDPGKRATIARQFAEIDPENAGQMLDFINKNPESQEAFLDKSILEAQTFGDVLKESRQETFTEVRDEQGNILGQRSSLTGKVITDPRTPGAPQERFTEVKDAKGNIIGQRSSLTGKVVTDPRTPVPATKTSLEKNLDAAGITDPKERRDIIVKSITKPNVKIDLNEGLDFKIPPGFRRDFDENGKLIGVKPIKGGPKDTLTAESAAKAQMLKTAQKAFNGARPLFFDEDGSVDRINVFNAQFNTPFTEGRKIRNKMEFGIQAITRGETGAAMPPEEVENTRDRFQPQLGDTIEIINLKLDMFEDVLSGTLRLIDPTGTFFKDADGVTKEALKLNQQKFDAELKRRSAGGTAPTTATQPQRNIVVDF